MDISKKADEIVDQAIGSGFAGTRAQILNLVADALAEERQKLDSSQRMEKTYQRCIEELKAEVERLKAQNVQAAMDLKALQEGVERSNLQVRDAAEKERERIKDIVAAMICKEAEKECTARHLGYNLALEDVVEAIDESTENRVGSVDPDVCGECYHRLDSAEHQECRRERGAEKRKSETQGSREREDGFHDNLC